MFSRSYPMCHQLIVVWFFPVDCCSFCHCLVCCTIGLSMPIHFSAVICHGCFHWLVKCWTLSLVCLLPFLLPFMAALFTACCAAWQCCHCWCHVTFWLQILQPASLIAALHHNFSSCWDHCTSIYCPCCHYCSCCHRSNDGKLQMRMLSPWLPPGWLLVNIFPLLRWVAGSSLTTWPAPCCCHRGCCALESMPQLHHRTIIVTAVASLPLHHHFFIISHW